jgi:TetR/AcrR family transcriptional repressor of mexJK operon
VPCRAPPLDVCAHDGSLWTQKQLSDAAQQTFPLTHGYAGASIDDIVRLKAGAWLKTTLYKYFNDKESLFQRCRHQALPGSAQRLQAVTFRGFLTEDALDRSGKGRCAFMVSPLAQAVYRTCIAESARFPQIGNAFY